MRGPSRPVQNVGLSNGKASQVSKGHNGSLDLSIHCPGKKKKSNAGQGDLKSSAREAVAWLFEVLRAEEERQVKAEKKKKSSSKAEFLRSIRFQKRDEKMGIGILNLVSPCHPESADIVSSLSRSERLAEEGRYADPRLLQVFFLCVPGWFSSGPVDERSEFTFAGR